MTKPSGSNNVGKGQKPRPPRSPVRPNASVSNVAVRRSDPVKPNIPKDTRIVTEAIVQRMLNSPNTSSDYKIISQSQFSDINLVADNIYLTGMFGITKEKFEKLHIIPLSVAAKTNKTPSLIVNATTELPNLIDYDCLRVFVSCVFA